jgi:2-amino-4-hydroxy-6-hydroxymethyldihydropteridine diphosphokinase
MKVFLALGSNIGILCWIDWTLGNRQKHLYTALSKLRSFTSIKDTSFVYDTKAMYEVNQNRFLNAVCKVDTDLSPSDLLVACKQVEKEMGRQKTYR